MPHAIVCWPRRGSRDNREATTRGVDLHRALVRCLTTRNTLDMTVSRSIWTQMAPDPSLPRVLAEFGFAPSSIESIKPLVSGAGRHQGYRVRAEHNDWVLKAHRATVATDRLRACHELESRLGIVGFPVAPLGRSRSGDSLVQEGSRWYSLHAWVVGRQVSIAERDELLASHPHLGRHLGSMVGLLHHISGQLVGPAGAREGGDPDLLLRAPRYAARALRRPRPVRLSRWHALHLKRSKSEFEQWMVHVFPEVAAAAGRLARRSIADRVDRSGMGLTHNDLNWENLVFDETLHLSAVLDFDNATWAPWVLEVGAAAVVLVGAEPAAVEEFLSAYERASHLQADRDLVRLGMEVKCVQSILNSMVTYLNGNRDITLRAPWCYHLYDSLTVLRQG